jgi:hypothetical protein
MGRSSSADSNVDNPQHAVQFDFLRALGGRLEKSVSKLVLLLREFGTQPLAYPWSFKKTGIAACASGTRWLIVRVVILQIGWCLLCAKMLSCQSRLGLLLLMLDHPCGLANSDQNCFILCLMPHRWCLGGVASMFHDSVTSWPSIDADHASNAFHRHVFSPLLGPVKTPDWPPQRRLHTAHENWFALAPTLDLPAEHAAL